MNDKALREALEQHEYQKFYLGAGCKCGWRTQLMHEADCWPAWCGHAAALSQPEQAQAFPAPVFAGYGAPGAIAPAPAKEAGTPQKGDVVWVRGIFDGVSIYEDEVRVLLHKRDDKHPDKPNHLYFVRRETVVAAGQAAKVHPTKTIKCPSCGKRLSKARWFSHAEPCARRERGKS